MNPGWPNCGRIRRRGKRARGRETAISVTTPGGPAPRLPAQGQWKEIHFLAIATPWRKVLVARYSCSMMRLLVVVLAAVMLPVWPQTNERTGTVSFLVVDQSGRALKGGR